MAFMSIKVEGGAAVRKRLRKVRAAATERGVAKRVADEMLQAMRRDAPSGRTSSRSIDLAPKLLRFHRQERNRWIEGIRIDTKAARGKAKAVAFGSRRHRAIDKFIQRGRDARKAFNRFRREFRKGVRKAAR